MPKASININDFGRGINTVKNPRDLAIGESPSITNFDTSNRGELRPRSYFNEQTDGTSYRIKTNGVDSHTASINPGYGLYYFEADDSIGVQGTTVTANGDTGSIADGPDGQGKYTICFYDSNKIFINDDNFWTTNNILSGVGSTNLPQRVIVSGAANAGNNRTFTVNYVLSLFSGDSIDVGSIGSHTMSDSMATAVLVVEESVTTENVSDGTSITFKKPGIVGDSLLALGNTDDGKIDIFIDSNNSFTSDAITLLNSSDANEKSEFVYYYINSSLRVSDANFRNTSTTKWYGYIDRNQFEYNNASGSGIGITIDRNFYEEDNNLASPSEFNLETTFNGTSEFPTAGSGWGLAVDEMDDEGEFEPGTYEFCSTFIYDGNQESLITKASDTKQLDGFKKIRINIFANRNGTEYNKRITGGRVYMREAESRNPWVLLADIDIRRGVRSSLVNDYKQWIEDSDGKYRITNDTTVGNRSSAYWDLFLDRPNIDTYESLNGYSPNDVKQISFGVAGAGYKTATISNRRAFVANVMYDDNESGSSAYVTEFNHYGDRIMFSEVGKYDLFPNFNFIDVVKGDGEDYVKLESYADRLLAYKQRTLQVINISSPSPSNWFLEETIQNAGVTNPYSVCKGSKGVVWANKTGVFLFNGSSLSKVTDGKIDDNEWSNFATLDKLSLGYNSKSDQVIIMQRVDNGENGYIYDLNLNSFVFCQEVAPNSTSSFNPPMTNFINDSSGNLIVAYDVEGTDLGGAGANKVHFTNWNGNEAYLNDYKVETPDINFGSLHKTKVVYKIYVHYKFVASSNALGTVDELIHTSSAPAVYYKADQKGEWRPMLRGYIENSENVLPNARFDRYWLDWLGGIINSDSSAFQNLDDLNLSDTYSGISLVSDGAGGRKLRADGTNSSGLLRTTSKVDKGVVYDTSMTLSNVTAGNVQFSFGGASGTARSTNGTFTEQITPTSTGAGFVFLNSSFAGDIENIILRPRTADQNGAYKIAVFSLEADTGVRCQSMAFKIEPSLTTEHQLYINDIQVEYRTIESQIA